MTIGTRGFWFVGLTKKWAEVGKKIRDASLEGGKSMPPDDAENDDVIDSDDAADDGDGTDVDSDAAEDADEDEALADEGASDADDDDLSDDEQGANADEQGDSDEEEEADTPPNNPPAEDNISLDESFGIRVIDRLDSIGITSVKNLEQLLNQQYSEKHPEARLGLSPAAVDWITTGTVSSGTFETLLGTSPRVTGENGLVDYSVARLPIRIVDIIGFTIAIPLIRAKTAFWDNLLPIEESDYSRWMLRFLYTIMEYEAGAYHLADAGTEGIADGEGFGLFQMPPSSFAAHGVPDPEKQTDWYAQFYAMGNYVGSCGRLVASVINGTAQLSPKGQATWDNNIAAIDKLQLPGDTETRGSLRQLAYLRGCWYGVGRSWTAPRKWGGKMRDSLLEGYVKRLVPYMLGMRKVGQ